MKNVNFEYDEQLKNNLKITPHEDFGDVAVYKIELSFDKPTPVKDITVKWFEPMLGILSVWKPEFLQKTEIRQWFDKNGIYSNFYKNSPLLCVINSQNNFSTLALSDAVTPTTIKFFVDDFAQKYEVCYELILFSDKETLVTEYTAYLRIDKTDCQFNTAVKNATDWACGFYKRKVNVCDNATAPLYSSWYSFHQHPDAKSLLEDLPIAKKLGFKTVILDDGWQYDGLGTADYYDCGDWDFSKEKFPNVKDFVDQLHALDMKLAVWFTVPFVGYNSNLYQKYKDKLLYNSDVFRAGIVDPRYPEIRKFLVNLYKDFTVKYGLDGLKLDFIDSFKLLPTSPAYNKDMDTESVEQAVILLLDEICEEINKVVDKPLFEFRQNYVGPAITAYCNMLRIADCAFDSITNRSSIANLRTLGYDVAVHSDMLYWSAEEDLLNIKRQLLNVLFSVPQISVILKDQRPDTLNLIKNYLDYWTENKELLLFGKFTSTSPELGYSVMQAENGVKTICLATENYTYSIQTEKTDIFNNGTKTDFVIISPKPTTAVIYDLEFNEIKTVAITKGANLLNVPLGGMISVG